MRDLRIKIFRVSAEPIIGILAHKNMCCFTYLSRA